MDNMMDNMMDNAINLVQMWCTTLAQTFGPRQ